MTGKEEFVPQILMDLTEGSGGIIHMIGCGKFLEVYKTDATFRVSQLSEDAGITDQRGRPALRASCTANVGASNFVVARVFIQAHESLQVAIFGEKIDVPELSLHMRSCKESILSAWNISEQLRTDIERISAEISGRGIERFHRSGALQKFPRVEDLETRCTNFFIAANRAIREICEIPMHFLNLPAPDTNFSYLKKRLSTAIGSDHPMVKFLEQWEDEVKYVIELRNYREHTRSAQTIIHDFEITGPKLVRTPQWEITGDVSTGLRPVMGESTRIVHLLTALAETLFFGMLMHCLDKRYPYVLTRDKLKEGVANEFLLSIDFSRIQWG